ncbi:zf-HC2 domain-containing protein [Zhaonella formicivorans]|uniref:zf-HC2 domain-containing protein n=1 Tax=Zhaonella formicivorans TaxID=2528593 RepID=UPI0010E68271|nr:zf-HC2 domain-containing protein [Zhaonella formicivorans]
MCFAEGTLQAFLDGELVDTELKAVEQHLHSCSHCQLKLARLRENLDFAQLRLASYANQLQKAQINREAAWEKLVVATDYRENSVRKGVLTMFNKYKKAVAVAAGVAVLSGALSISSVRSFAADFLNIFRVEKIQTISINADDLNELRWRLSGSEGQFNLDNFGEFIVANKQESRELTLEQAKEEAGFAFRVIAGYEQQVERVFKEGGNQVSLKLHVDKVNAVIKSLGGKELLPDGLEGKEFTITIQDAYMTDYFDAQTKTGFTHGQMQSPQLAVPKGVDVLALRKALLELPFLPDNLRKQLAAVEDWQHTVLIPDLNGSSQEVAVDGTQGVFISNKGSSYGTLIWQKDGVINMLQGNFSLEKALDLAGRLR